MANNKKLRRKILIIGLFPPPITGQAVATQALFEELKKRDIDVDKIALSNRTNVESFIGKFMKIFENLTVFIIYLWKIPFGKKIVYISPAASTLGFFRDFPAITLSHLFGQKVIAHFHIGDYKTFVDSRSPFLRKWIVRTMLKVDKIILLAENIRPNFDISPLISDKVTIVSNGIPEVENNSSPKSLGGREGDEIVLLFLSNMIQSKGYMDVLKTTELLVFNYGLNIKTLFCGQFMTSPDDVLKQSTEQAEKHFRDFVVEKQLENHISFMGIVRGDKKAEVLKKAHVFLLPTEYYIEGLPISIIEAMSVGVPVIATAHRGIPDLVLDGQTGFLIKGDKASFMAEKINELAQNRAVYDALSQASVTHFKTHFTADRHFDNVVAVLKELDTES